MSTKWDIKLSQGPHGCLSTCAFSSSPQETTRNECVQGLISVFTGDLISNSEALKFISYYPIPILHILTKCHGLQAGTSLLLLLWKMLGSRSQKRGESEADLISPQFRILHIECPRNHFGIQTRSREANKSPGEMRIFENNLFPFSGSLHCSHLTSLIWTDLWSLNDVTSNPFKGSSSLSLHIWQW